VSGFTGTMTLINQGTIRVDRAGTTFGNGIGISANLVNNGLVRVERQSIIQIAGTWDNTNGILQSTAATSQLQLAGTVKAAAFGTMDIADGSALTFSGTLDNSNSTLTIDSTTNPILYGGTLSGGNLAFGDGLDTNPGKMFKTLKGVNVLGAISYRESGT
jgi:hypothetical protein